MGGRVAAWVVMVAVALAAAVVAHPHHAKQARGGAEDVLYDQRQNGTENYRLHIDGVVVALAPAEVLFNLAGLLDGFLPDGTGGEEIPEDDLYPPKPEAGTELELTTQPDSATSTTEAAEQPEAKPETKPEDKPDAETKPEADVEEPNRDTTENAEKPATSETAASAAGQPHKPTKKLKGKIFLSRWLLPLLRRL